MKGWWHRRRYASCAMCGREFRKGEGGGVSRRTICDEQCWAWAWAEFVRPGIASAEIAEKRRRMGVTT